jgi:hypothetical protein
MVHIKEKLELMKRILSVSPKKRAVKKKYSDVLPDAGV